MAIPAEDIAKVRASIDISALIGERTSLRKVGRRYVGLCPFHTEKSPSFSVNAEEGIYHCFGCQASGDAISFVQAVEGCDFVEAVERLAARGGVTIRNDADASNDPARGRRAALYEALTKAAAYYHQRLLEEADAGRARQYLRSRGYDGAVVRRFHIGFASAGWDDLVRSLRLPVAIAKEAGLCFENSRGRVQDTFRERIIFPIFDPGDRVIALGGRILPEELRRSRGEVGPKYRNSPESSIYQKRATLYGLNWAKAEMARSNEAIVCEGYTDVIGFFQAGLPKAVATCGTALTEDHFRLLSRFAKRVILCFDSDNAGQNATARLYEWESRHELEVAVASLPRGSDPAELARDHPELLQEAIGAARPYLAFLLDRVLRSELLTTPEARARAAQSAVAIVSEHPSALVRDEYLLEIADRTHHRIESLRQLLEEARRRPREELPERARGDERTRVAPPQSGEAHAGREEPPPRDEEGFEPADVPRRAAAHSELRAGRDALLLAINRPQEVAGLLNAALFVDPLQRRAFEALASADELHQAIDGADVEVADLLRRLAASPDADELAVDGTIIELVRNAAGAALLDLDRSLRLATLHGDAAALAMLSGESRLVRETLEALRDPLFLPDLPSPAMQAAERLVAWLSNREPEN